MPDDSEQEWPEPTPLSHVLTEYEAPKRGRPKKGQEKDHGLDAGFYEVRDEMAESGIRPLENQPERGAVRIEKENPRHRVLVYLFAQGGTAKNVFQQLGGEWDETNNRPISGTGEFSYQHLLNIRRQPWFQNELLAVIAENGSPLVEARLQLEMMASVETIIEIRDNEKEKGATRLAASNSLLDRYLGKPAQTVRTEAPSTTASHEAEANELRERLKRLEQEAHHLNPAFVPTES